MTSATLHTIHLSDEACEAFASLAAELFRLEAEGAASTTATEADNTSTGTTAGVCTNGTQATSTEGGSR